MKKVLGFSVIYLIIPLIISGCGGSGGGNPLAGGFFALQVSAGNLHTCAVQSNGQVKCWGVNSSGQLGDGTGGGSFLPVTVANLFNVSEVSAGGRHTCARLKDGTVQCWGDNTFGQMGNNGSIFTPPFFTPTQVSDITKAVSISAGENHSCAVLSDGTVACWGDNTYGQLGNGTRNPTLTPVKVSGINTATDVSAGGSHTCALLVDGSVFCWGNNSSGQLGNGTSFTDTPPTPAFSTVPLEANLTGATSIATAAGANHTCAVITGGTVRCWGDDTFGQIGQPYTPIGVVASGPVFITFSTFPVPVTDVSTAVGVTAGARHSCANLSGGGVQCWGDDSSGQLGNGAFFGPAPVAIDLPNTTWLPVSVKNLVTATQVDAGFSHTCAHLSNNIIACWGDNSAGQLGTGNLETSKIPLGVAD